mmetsp:Transcript_52007/g.160235  ORF Transcript_52007/g.160235 Transcript_52007/m.160235 type:complete len:251 (+) Transcript_52007:224-976(+)
MLRATSPYLSCSSGGSAWYAATAAPKLRFGCSRVKTVRPIRSRCTRPTTPAAHCRIAADPGATNGGVTPFPSPTLKVDGRTRCCCDVPWTAAPRPKPAAASLNASRSATKAAFCSAAMVDGWSFSASRTVGSRTRSGRYAPPSVTRRSRCCCWRRCWRSWRRRLISRLAALYSRFSSLRRALRSASVARCDRSTCFGCTSEASSSSSSSSSSTSTSLPTASPRAPPAAARACSAARTYAAMCSPAVGTLA